MEINVEIRVAAETRLSELGSLNWLAGGFVNEFWMCGYLSPLLDQDTFSYESSFVPYFYEDPVTEQIQVGIRAYFAKKSRKTEITDYLLDFGQFGDEDIHPIYILPDFFARMTRFEEEIYRGVNIKHKFQKIQIPGCGDGDGLDFLTSVFCLIKENSKHSAAQTIWYNRNRIPLRRNFELNEFQEVQKKFKRIKKQLLTDVKKRSLEASVSVPAAKRVKVEPEAREVEDNVVCLNLVMSFQVIADILNDALDAAVDFSDVTLVRSVINDVVEGAMMHHALPELDKESGQESSWLTDDSLLFGFESSQNDAELGSSSNSLPLGDGMRKISDETDKISDEPVRRLLRPRTRSASASAASLRQTPELTSPDQDSNSARDFENAMSKHLPKDKISDEPREHNVNFQPSFISRSRKNIVPGAILELKEILRKNFDDALYPIEKKIKNESFSCLYSYHTRERSNWLKYYKTANNTIESLKRDRNATLAVIEDLQGQSLSFPITDHRVFTSHEPGEGLLFDVLLKGGPKYDNYQALRRTLGHEYLFGVLSDVIKTVKLHFSQWVGLDFSAVSKSAKAPCVCCEAELRKELINRTKFGECKSSCRASFYCLNKLGKVYISPRSEDICEICRNVLLKNLARVKK